MDVYFTPAPDRVIVEMLRVADVGPEDVVMDLGCGDGRIVIEAARRCRARGIGVDLDERLLEAARAAAKDAGVGDLVEVRRENFFAADLSACSVLALYLTDTLNVRLRPKILSEARPGTRVVTYSFEMGDWDCDEHFPIAANGVWLWIVPANVAGEWVLTGPDGDRLLRLRQKYQMINGEVDRQNSTVVTGRAKGAEITLSLQLGDASPVQLTGRVDGDELRMTDSAGLQYVAHRQASNDPSWTARSGSV